jgi:glycine oxidase
LKKVRFGILGGGLAGTLLSLYLKERGVLVLDEKSEGRGSNAPSALFHPFPGRYLQSSPQLVNALEAALPLYEKWASTWPQWVQSRVMLRPLVGKTGERLERSLEKNQTSEIAGVRVEKWGAEDVAERFSGISHEGQLLSYGSSFSIDLEALLSHLADEQERAGTRKRIRIHDIQRIEDGWLLRGPGWEGQVSTLIFASGSQLQDWLPTLRGTVEGGQLLRLTTSPVDWLVSRGDIHWCPSEGGAVVGSTRWHSGEKPIAQEVAIELLSGRAQTLCTTAISAGALWQGERLVTEGERLPYVGPVPGESHAFMLGGLGSKGLLFAPWSAKVLAAHLVDGTALPSCLQPRMSGEGPSRTLRTSVSAGGV